MAITGRGGIAYPPSADQSLAAGDDIELTGKIVRVTGNGGAVTLTSTPTIEAGEEDGQIVIIQGTDNTNTVTLQDKSSLAGTTLALDAQVDATLGQGDTLMLMWDAGDSLYYEISRANVTP